MMKLVSATNSLKIFLEPKRLSTSFSAAYNTKQRLFSDDGFIEDIITGYKISNKYYHFNDTHRTSFIKIDMIMDTDFVEGRLNHI